MLLPLEGAGSILSLWYLKMMVGYICLTLIVGSVHEYNALEMGYLYVCLVGLQKVDVFLNS